AAAEIQSDGQTIGRLGELTKGLIDTGTMAVKLFAFEIDLEAVLSLTGRTISAKPPARLPSVSRDLAVVVAADEAYLPLREEIAKSAGPTLELLQLVDVYRGSQIPADKKSLAFRLEFRDPARTLTAEEVSETMARIVTALESRFGARLRA